MSSVTIGSLVADLTLNTARFDTDIRRARQQADGLGGHLQRAFNGIAGGVTKAIGAVAKYGAVLASVASIAGAAMVNSSLQTIDVLAKQSDAIGIATERLAGYQLAGELTGVKVESVNKAMQRMVRSVGDASDGLSTQVRAFDKLGLNIETLKQLNAADQFELIADRINGLSTQADKAAVASAIFGREGVNLLNTFKLGAKGLQDITKEAEQYGIAVTRVDAAKIEQANDAITRAKAASKGFANTLTVAVAPILTALVDEFSRASRETGGFKNQIDGAMRFAVKAIGLGADAVRGLQLAFLAIRMVAAEVINKVIQDFRDLNNVMIRITSVFDKVLPDSFINARDAGLSFINDFADSFNHTTEGLAQSYYEALAKPVPSEQVDAFFDHALERSQQLAEQTAATSVTGNAIGLFTDDQLQKLDEQAQQRVDFEKRYQKQLTDAANEAAWQRFQFEKMTSLQKTKFMIDQSVALTQGVAQSNKTLFNINKIFTKAKIALEAPGAISSAIKNAGGLPWGAWAGIMTAAKYVGLLQAANSASYGSGAAPSLAGQGGGSQTFNTVPIAPQPQQNTATQPPAAGIASTGPSVVINFQPGSFVTDIDGFARKVNEYVNNGGALNATAIVT